MSDEPKNLKTEEPAATPSAETQKPEPGDQEHMIPKSRLDAVIAERASLESELTAFKKTALEAEEQRLKDQEDWKTLAGKHEETIASLTPKAETAEAQEKTLQSYLEAQVAELPEDMRSMVPEQLTTMQKLEWLATNGAKLRKTPGFDIGAGQRGGSEDTKTAALNSDELAMAKRAGMSAEDYAKYKE